MSRDKRIYHSFHPWKLVLRIFLILLAAFVALSIFFYVWFKKYIVYTDNGLYLDIPWLQDIDG